MLTTEATSPEDVQTLLDLAYEQDGSGYWQRSRLTWAELQEAIGWRIKYSRAWLLVKRREYELFRPELLVDLDAIVGAAKTEFNEVLADWLAAHDGYEDLPADKQPKPPEFDSNAVYAEVVRRLRLDEDLSWGEISVCMNIPESRVRSLFKYESVLQDIGLRIGKGGRHLMDDETLYTEYRVKEGAAIATGVKRSEVKRQPERLLNAEVSRRKLIPTAALANKTSYEQDRKRQERNAAVRAKRAAKRAAQ